ncbi:RdRP-domain-containing protein [Amylocystis lapponica]|nr:RdRP-domain-containing protein [Amylocystis lapponica]
MLKKSKTTVLTARFHNGTVHSVTQEQVDSSRATRIVDDATRFLIIKVNKKTDNDNLRLCLAKWMRGGMVVQNTSYTFFGFSENHVKNGRLVFFREDDVWTVERVLQQLGDLRSVFVKSGYGKYSARLGLSFSSTVESLDVPNEQALKLKDWRAQDGSLHSDGCGMIRDSLAAQVCSKLELPSDTSVFQIRRGGIKGLLVRYPDKKFDKFCGLTRRQMASQPPYLIAYRDSMLKYEGGPTMIELNDHSSSPPSARLNIQFIILLLCLDISREVFEQMVKDQLDIIGSIVHDREKAERYIRGELDAADTSTYNQDLYALLLAKHDLQEPYVQWRLKQFQKLQYDSLRNKLNLRVEESCRVFGVVDEDGILEEDEVFINLPGRTGVLVRNVLVGRNPCYSPGDLRKFRAVNYEELNHHKYCIVFSRKARHSIPDTMSSGDLDGDEYFVTWDPALIPKRMAPPLDRAPALSADTAKRNMRSRSDMKQAAVDTFVQQKFGGLLGRMVNEWTKAAEATSQLANAPLPQALVPLIESAHDIMKSGDDPAELQRKFAALTGKARGASRPYISPVQRLRNMVPQQDLANIDKFECDPALILRDQDPGLWEDFTSEARSVLQQYNKALSVAIREDADDGDYEASSEREKRKEPRHADRVKQQYCSDYFGGGNLREQFRQRFRASAWYCYGYSQRKQSFAWLGERYLNNIRARKQNRSTRLDKRGETGTLRWHRINPTNLDF